MHLGIDSQAGFVYEGLGNPELPVVPSPNITQAKLIESEADWQRLPSGYYQTPLSWIFREDSFDAVTRTRRGRLYASQVGQAQPGSQRVSHHPYEDPMMRQVGSDGRQVKTLYTFVACTELIVRADRGLGCTIALGTQQAASAWRIIQTEILASGCVLVTLKALSVFGLIPEVDIAKIDPEFRPSVTQAMDRVLDSAFRETPISVIDHCRNAMTMVISRWLVQDRNHDRGVLGSDLGKLASLLLDAPYKMACLANLASMVARLHSRGKGNEQHNHGAREPVDEDAQIAIESLGFALREIQWARG